MNTFKKSTPYVILTIIIGGGVAAQALIGANAEKIPVTTTAEQILIPITESPTFAGCAFVWAYHDLPDTTKKLDESIKVVQSDASASAQAYGEDCIYADGTYTFGAMETDFYITFQADITFEEEMGNLIKQGMKVIQDLPKELVPGAQAGRVTFTFKQSGEELIVLVDINQYNELTPDISGVDIYQTFKSP